MNGARRTRMLFVIEDRDRRSRSTWPPFLVKPSGSAGKAPMDALCRLDE
jgi:hypothetical protein